MQPAPAVSVACRDQGAWRVVQTTLAGLAGANLLAWVLAWLESPWPIVAAGSGLVAIGIVALRWRSLRADPSTLAWDGQQWRLDECPMASTGVTVVIDLGSWMLLRLAPQDGSAHWRALSEGGVGPGWRGLRSALFAAAPAAPPVVA